MHSTVAALLLFQAAFFAVILVIFRKHIKSGTYLIATICGALIPFTFLFGIFFGGFDANICYSNAISNLKIASKLAVQSESAEVREAYVKALDAVVVSGYESQCSLIEVATQNLYKTMKSINVAGGGNP